MKYRQKLFCFLFTGKWRLTLGFNILLTTSSLWILWAIVNFVRSNGGSVTLMVQQPAKDGNNTINYTILLHMPRTYYGKNYLRINFFNGCEYDNCKVTFDPDLLYRSDAVVFHHDMMQKNPPRKRDNQIWIFASFETPFYTHNVYKKYKFDWVMSYRVMLMCSRRTVSFKNVRKFLRKIILQYL